MYGVSTKAKEISLDMTMIGKSLAESRPSQERVMSGSNEGCTTESVNVAEGDREDHGHLTRARRRLAKEVQTEFVYRGDEDFSRVHVCGDWNNWRPIAMHLEEESDKLNCRRKTNHANRTWSVITPVTIGYHEFYFMTDCHMTVSRRHLMTPDGKRNWRRVHGPRGVFEDAERLAESSVREKWVGSKVWRTLDRLADGLYVFACKGRTGGGNDKRERVDGSKNEDRRDREQREKVKENTSGSVVCKQGVSSLTTLLLRGVVVCGLVGMAVMGTVRLRGALMSFTSM